MKKDMVDKILDKLQEENNKSKELLLKCLETEDESYFNQHLKHVYAIEVLLELLGIDIKDVDKYIENEKLKSHFERRRRK